MVLQGFPGFEFLRVYPEPPHISFVKRNQFCIYIFNECSPVFIVYVNDFSLINTDACLAVNAPLRPEKTVSGYGRGTLSFSKNDKFNRLLVINTGWRGLRLLQ